MLKHYLNDNDAVYVQGFCSELASGEQFTVLFTSEDDSQTEILMIHDAFDRLRLFVQFAGDPPMYVELMPYLSQPNLPEDS